MKVAIEMDEDTIDTILTSKREECIKMLKSIDEGDIWSDYALRELLNIKSCDEKGVKL